MRLKRDFFARNTLTVAQELLGKYLVFGKCVGQITETEAYIGENDPACHACRGLTPRNQPMFGPPRFSYIYFIYGMYYCLNFVTEKKDFPAAVLIRGIKPIEGIEIMQKRRDSKISFSNLANGPGKLCQTFGLTKKENNLDLCTHPHFYLEEREKNIPKFIQTPRIGIKTGLEHHWRFITKNG